MEVLSYFSGLKQQDAGSPCLTSRVRGGNAGTAAEVRVQWDENDVTLDLNQGMENYDATEYQAYEYFINDSFWLVAPFKVRDKGVTRSTVELKNGRGLLVSYSSGGLTPGDSYLWIINNDGFPTSWKLYTSNVPIGGLEIGWGGWTEKEESGFPLFTRAK